MSQSRFTPETARLDDAARAGWLYYVAGNTQDEIAKKLGVSRQSAQRLVSLAVSEKLVKVRLDHPIARCMDLSGALTERFDLRVIEVVPSDPTTPELLAGIAIAAAAELEKLLKSPEEKIIALGTGRALRACVEQLPRMDCPQHRIVSRLGNIMSDGSATPYNAVIRMAERVGAKHYPYPLPVRARDEEELRVMHGMEPARHTMELCARADFTLVGVGQVGPNAPIHVDGFLGQRDMDDLIAQGVVGEITSWVYDAQGRIMDCEFNRRVASAPLPMGGDAPVVGLATGPGKAEAILAALQGGLINGLITDEATAERLLRQEPPRSA